MPLPSVPLDAIRQPAMLFDAGGRIIAANAAADGLADRSLAGLSQDDLVRIFRHRRPDGSPLAVRDLPSALAMLGEHGGTVEVPLVITAADGRTLEIVGTASPIVEAGAVTGILVVWRDVTGQRRAEADACSNALFPLQNPFPVVRADSEGRILAINPAGGAALAAWGAEVGNALPDELAGEVRAARREGAQRRVELRVGSTVYAVAVVPLPGESYVNLYFSDVTERARAEEEIERHRATLKAALESMTDVMVISDAEGRLVEVNGAFAPFYRFGSRDDFLWTVAEYPDILEAFFPDGTPAPPEQWVIPRALRGETGANVEYRLRRKDTGETWVASYGFGPIRDDAGTIAGAVAVGRDITERKAAEAALAASGAKYRELFERMAEAFALHEVVLNDAGVPIDYRFLTVNPAFEALTGYAADAIVGRTAGELHPGIEPWCIETYGRVATTGESAHFEACFPPLGRWYDVHAYSPGPGQFATVFSDVTERMEAEAALRHYAKDLRQSNEDLERYAYVSSHDLQEPLRSIVSFSQLLEKRYKGQLGQDADDYIKFVVDGGTRMQGLILDLLAFSRVNTTRQQIARTDAEDVFAEAVRTLDVSLREAEATLTHDPLPVVAADPTQLAQVFSNLISNAVKFRRPDVPLQIHVGVRRTDGSCEFSVSDNGIGIEPEYFDRIFVIFQRLHTKDAYPGTGIGLAIVKRIIDRHGGTIRVESTPGEGTTFYFTLPAA